MLKLHQYPGIWGLPSLSPFCLKVETYLRMRNLPYAVVTEINPRRGPKGKMPVLQDDKLIIPDSTFIIDYLEKKYGALQGLSDVEQAVGLAMQRMIEEHLYFIILYSRWIDREGKKIINQAFCKFFPRMIATGALAYIRFSLRKQGFLQGIARHSREEVYALGIKDLQAISHWLGDKPYFFGEKLSYIDASVFAFMVTILLTPLDNPLQRTLKKEAQVIQYCERMRKRYFAESMPSLLS